MTKPPIYVLVHPDCAFGNEEQALLAKIIKHLEWSEVVLELALTFDSNIPHDILWTTKDTNSQKLQFLHDKGWTDREFIVCGFFENKCVAAAEKLLKGWGIKASIDSKLTLPHYDVDDDED